MLAKLASSDKFAKIFLLIILMVAGQVAIVKLDNAKIAKIENTKSSKLLN